MRGVWTVEQIRAAERQVMAELPPGTLMARAARAIAVTVSQLLGFDYGARVLLLVGAGRLHAGDIRLVDIGITQALPTPAIRQLEAADVALRRPGPADDKYTRGVVGVAAGSAAYPGAALLCTGSARLGGVGAVRYAGHAAREVVRSYPEVLV